MGMQHKPPKLMDRVKAVMRVKRYSPRTEKTYCYWMRYFIRYHGIRHPATMGPAEVQAFLEHLAVERYVAAATQNQALNALVFLYRHVFDKPLGDIGIFSRAKRPRRLPIAIKPVIWLDAFNGYFDVWLGTAAHRNLSFARKRY
ncbi:phage integrase N-terminal SAM-like domain-containing protein [Halomonas sp. MC140]|nr:phage integrase N-terminal SAM-like domain-containing protein [Halomonas sp. MC140]MDN7133712.1 phage integrase N-terminal SAM-like domain-containing protein [Halomonas sp. MC140]